MSEPEQFEEWRVTGVFANGQAYDFTWSPNLNPHLEQGEQAARAFTALFGLGAWREGPHLRRRTVTRTPWEQVEQSAADAVAWTRFAKAAATVVDRMWPAEAETHPPNG